MQLKYLQGSGVSLTGMPYLQSARNAEFVNGILTFGNKGDAAGLESSVMPAWMCRIISDAYMAYTKATTTPSDPTLVNRQAYMVINAFCLGVFQQLYPKAGTSAPNISISPGSVTSPKATWANTDTPCFPGALYTLMAPADTRRIGDMMPSKVDDMLALATTMVYNSYDNTSFVPKAILGIGVPSQRPTYMCIHQLQGYLRVDSSGYYEFGLNSKDAAVLFISDAPVASWMGIHDSNKTTPVVPGGTTSKIYLKKGDHRFKLMYTPSPSTANRTDAFVQVLHRKNPLVTPSWLSKDATNTSTVTNATWAVWPEDKISHSLMDYKNKLKMDIAIGSFMTDWVDVLFRQVMGSNGVDPSTFFDQYLSADSSTASTTSANLKHKVTGMMTDRLSILALYDQLQGQGLNFMSTSNTVVVPKTVIKSALEDTFPALKTTSTGVDEAMFYRIYLISFLPLIHFRSLMSLADFYRSRKQYRLAAETDIAMMDFVTSAVWMISQSGCKLPKMTPADCAGFQECYKLFGAHVLKIGDAAIASALAAVKSNGRAFLVLEDKLANVSAMARTVEVDGSVGKSLEFNGAMERRRYNRKVWLVIVLVFAILASLAAAMGVVAVTTKYPEISMKWPAIATAVVNAIVLSTGSVVIARLDKGEFN